MNIKTALKELDNSWSRDIIFEKIKNGQAADKIVNDFIKSNRSNIELVSNFIEKNNSNIFENIEQLSICEIKLIREIKALQVNDLKILKEEASSKEIKNKFKDFNFALFLQKWSNSFVIYLLILISLVSLTKQAWAL